LVKLRSLAVISSTTATQYDRRGKSVAQIGKDMGVGYVVEGSVRWERGGAGPGRVRITPELIRVADDTHVWSQRYDRQLGDTFDIEAEVADDVAQALYLTLGKGD
jgi:TolB-like protein